MNDQQQSRADALTEAVTHTIETIKRQLDLIADRAPSNFLDKRSVVQSLTAHVRRLEKALAASPVEQPALLTAQDALAAIETFEIVGDNNDSREPNAEDRFILTEFVAHLFGGFRVELPAATPASANETGAEGATWYDRWQAECTRDHGEYDENAPIADRLRWWVPKSARHGTILLEDDLREAADELSRSPAMAAEAQTDWRELSRRLYVELFHCDQQMRSTRDEDGEPHWTQSTAVRDVLADAKAALDLPIGTLGALFAIQRGFGAQAAMAAVAPADERAAGMPDEVRDSMMDSQYLAGVTAGWNAANADDPNAALKKIHDAYSGYLNPLRDWQKAGRPGAPATPATADERAECIAWANANGFPKYHESMCAAWEERARRAAASPAADDRKYTQADMERYGRAVADAREKRTTAAAQPAQASAAAVIPEGWKLVPTEPTMEMQIAARRADKEYQERMGLPDYIGVGGYDHYVAMLHAAPQPAQADAPAEAREPIAWVTDDDRAITAAQKQRALADGGATASSVRPYSIPCYAVSAPADAGEGREPIGPHDLSTTAGGRSYVAEFFAKRLRRHDFGRYITGQLAADFACSLAAYLRDHDHAAADAGEAQPYAYVAPVSNYATRNKIVADRIGGLIPVYTAQPAARVASLTDAARDMLAERRRQVEAEGWTPKHDDEHDKGEMARAAACYALHAGSCFAWRADAYQSAKPHEGNPAAQDSLWPWDMQWWKPKDPRRDLVRAGALFLAELERLDRATLLNGADKS